MSSDTEQLRARAIAVRQQAHAPYSKFAVGAALVDNRGAIHSGCNVENAAYPLGSCAEANAIGAMIAAGGSKIERLLVVGGVDDLELCLPCGGCRQRIAEFSVDETEILAVDEAGKIHRHSLAELLPHRFVLKVTK